MTMPSPQEAFRRPVVGAPGALAAVADHDTDRADLPRLCARPDTRREAVATRKQTYRAVQTQDAGRRCPDASAITARVTCLFVAGIRARRRVLTTRERELLISRG
jgi:hypothetical protein